jgi:ABC-type multidrug transport system fused ATPase/permease subunit
MEPQQHELYEYARKRIKEKKRLYYHFVLLTLGSLFLFISTKIFSTYINSSWYVWVITLWVFLFVLHFIKVFITDRFMNKNWEREQIDRLVSSQEKKINELQTVINEDTQNKHEVK